jgi:dUTP pyrophosphatase
MQTIKFKKLNPSAVVPSFAKEGDAGLDLTAISRTTDSVHPIVEFGTGLAAEIPEGYVGFIFPRSSIKNTALILRNSVGVIDSGYRGEIRIVFLDIEPNVMSYKIGDRVAQLVIVPYLNATIEEVEELSPSDRGEHGFGSTGK